MKLAVKSKVWETINNLINGVVGLLSKLIIAAIVLVIFWLLAKGERLLMRRLTDGVSGASS